MSKILTKKINDHQVSAIIEPKKGSGKKKKYVDMNYLKMNLQILELLVKKRSGKNFCSF